MFVPQVITAVTTSLAEDRPRPSDSVSKQVYLAGLAGDLAAMVLLIVSHFVATPTTRSTYHAAAGRHGVPEGRLRS